VTSRVSRTVLPVALSLAVAAPAAAAGREFKWDELKKQGRIVAGSVLAPEPGSSEHRLQIENKAGLMTATVLTVEPAQVKGPRYAISGRVRYDGVEGVGYLEMWSYFPGGGQYFSRTLGDQGPMMKLQGTSRWRNFVLPFDATGAAPPARLVVNVVLPGRGTVYLGSIQLNEEKALASAIGDDGGEPAPVNLPRLTATAGSIVGGLGALMGVLTSLGRARRLVLTLAASLVAVGAAVFVAGIVGISSSPSPAEGYPALLVFGFLASVVPLGLLPTIRKRYEDAELRTMRAHDIIQR
jgi:hypothetical protein